MADNDKIFINLARRGDDDAFAQLVEIYQRPVYNLCHRMLGTPQEAEDAAQETFWRAYQALQRYDTRKSFATWLLSIAAHYCIDQLRRRKLPTFALELLPDESVPGISPGPETVLVHSEKEHEIQALLDNLNPKDRAAIILRYWYEFSEKEIAQTLKLSVGAVKSRLHRSRRALALDWQSSRQESQVLLEDVT